jgi:chromosome segregation ATPase
MACVGRRPAWLRPAARVAGAALVVAALAAPVPASAATYKWVDDNGVVHYTDKMPPEAVNKGSVELSKQGVPVRKTDPALTPEQRRAREQEAERQAQAKKTQEETARRDRALLASYSSESEIDLARNRTLATIDTAVQSANAYSEQLSRRRSELMAKKAGYGDKPVPPALQGELDSLNAEITRQTELIARKKSEAVSVAARYDADKQRWRELTAARAAAEAAGKAGGATTAATGAVPAGGR